MSAIPGTLWDAGGRQAQSVFELLTAMQESIQDNGFGGQIVTWAGKAAYNALFAIAEASVTTAKMRVEITGKGHRRGRLPGGAAQRTQPQPADRGDDAGGGRRRRGDGRPGCRTQAALLRLDDLDANLQPCRFSSSRSEERPEQLQAGRDVQAVPGAQREGHLRATVLS
ncbi:hypothetical protein [Desulfolutivibrio sulfodismutans]|uniref:hypothetical protein n=1 Tax=Desulfolutivibrio sulfodismutans TaxID=63561 RepID=UPI00159D35E3|nr:hypothetical protein [Desulfolutivibrio sulfodismutans]QLA14184.1 hypothetical protein GD606_18885 [Desulfolutivibrio sulfodismutans DSM 3696]